MEKELTWRDVFDSEKKRWGFIVPALEAAHAAGYEYMTWNGYVYQIIPPTDGKAVDAVTTHIFIQEVT